MMHVYRLFPRRSARLTPDAMKRIPAITVLASFLLTLCLLSPTAAVAQDGNPIYYATNYGVIGDDKTDDTSAMQALLALVSSKGGGYIQIPCNGTFTLIASGILSVPGSVHLLGCGKYGNDIGIPVLPAGGLDLRYNGEYKMEWLAFAQNTVRDMAFVDFNTNPKECAPFFFISNSVVDFEHFSVQGNVTAPYQTGACQTVFTFGANVPQCGEGGTSECFNGYGAEIFDGFFDRITYGAILNSGANGIYFTQDFGTSSNGNYQGTSSPKGPAFLINPTQATSGLYPYGNHFENIQWELGDAQKPFHTNYTWGMEILCCSGTNFFYDFNCSDVEMAKGCMHIAAVGPNHIDHQEIDGCATSGYPFPGCVQQDDAPTNYQHVVINGTDDQILARQYYGTDLGTSTYGYNDLNLASGGWIYAREGPAVNGQALADIVWGDSASHRLKMNNNNAGPVQVVGSGVDIDTNDHVVKVNGGALPPSAGFVGTNASSQLVDAAVPVTTSWSVQKTGNVLLALPIQGLPAVLKSGTYQVNITLSQSNWPSDCDTFPMVELFLGFTDLIGNWTASPAGIPWVSVLANGVTVTNQLQLASIPNRNTTGTGVFQLSLKTGTPFTYQVFQNGNATKGGGPCVSYPIVKSTVTIIGPLS
jgi:hypothetical protein